MAEKLGEAVVMIVADDTDYRKTVGQAEDRAHSAGASIRKSLGNILVGTAAAGLAVGKIINSQIRSTVETSIDAFKRAEAINSRFANVLGEMTDDAEAFVNAFSEETGLSKILKRDQVARLFAFAQAMGASKTEALELSKNMSSLATDFRSFFDLGSDQESFQKILSGLSGETEPLKILGIVVNDTAVKKRALSRSVVENVKDLTEWQKVLIRSQLIAEQGAVALGDFTKTMGEFGNQSEITEQQRFERLAAQGEAFKEVVLERKRLAEEASAAVDSLIVQLSQDPRTSGAMRKLLFVDELIQSIPILEQAAGLLGNLITLFAAGKVIGLGGGASSVGSAIGSAAAATGKGALAGLGAAVSVPGLALGAAGAGSIDAFLSAERTEDAFNRIQAAEELQRVLKNRRNLRAQLPGVDLPQLPFQGINEFQNANSETQALMLEELMKNNAHMQTLINQQLQARYAE